MPDLLVSEKRQESFQLPDAEPFDQIDMLYERRIRFICERCSDNLFHAGLPRGVSERSRINAVAGDDPESFRRLQVCRASRCVARLSILGMMSAAFDVQLRQRLLK